MARAWRRTASANCPPLAPENPELASQSTLSHLQVGSSGRSRDEGHEGVFFVFFFSSSRFLFLNVMFYVFSLG